MIQSVNKYHIYEILSSDGNFYYTIPKYQREYTWSYREWEALYDDISENNESALEATEPLTSCANTMRGR